MARAKEAGKPKGRGARHHLAEELERRVMLASAIAAFAPQITFGAASVRSVNLADVNGDGKADLLAVSGYGNWVGVALGTGNGSFGGMSTFTVGNGPFCVTAADVNRDGKPDLVVANSGAGTVSVLLGNGNGQFQGHVDLTVGSQPRWVVAADVNGDGKPDIVSANYGSGSASVLLGNGNGTFAGQQAFGAGAQASSIALGDFNRDGKLDLAVSNKSAGTVTVLVGNGLGGFTSAGAMGAGGAGAAAFSVASGDFNQDGKLDLAVAEETAGVVGVMLGNGNGTFGNQTTFGASAIACAVAVGDVNGDGKLDVAVANYNATNVGVLLGNGNGSFQTQKTFATGTNSKPFSLALGDVNRDGRQDLVAGDFGINAAGMMLGDPPPYVVSINRAGPRPQTSASSVNYIVTFNVPVTGVDVSDFAVATTGAAVVTGPVVVSGGPQVYTVILNEVSGEGSVQLNMLDDGSIHDIGGNRLSSAGVAAFAPQATYADPVEPFSVVTADFNDDGVTDLAVANNNDSAWGVTVLNGNGDGTFAAARTQVANFADGIAVGDVNGDGQQDLVVGAGGGISSRSYGSVLLGNGNGTFRSSSPVPLGGGQKIHKPLLVDLNGDGRLDLVTLNANPPWVGIGLGNGNGTFAAPLTLATTASPAAASVGDFDADGRPDLVVADGGGGTGNAVSVFTGCGDGTFGPRRTFAVGNGPAGVAVGDVNGDGRIDIVIANYGSTGSPEWTLSELLGVGDGTFQAQRTLHTGLNPNNVAISDVNGDGKPDLVTTNGALGAATGEPPGAVGVFLGNGDGSFSSARTFSSAGTPFGAAVGDFDNDGRVDIAVPGTGAHVVGVLLGAADLNLLGQVYQTVPPYAVLSRLSPATESTGAGTVSFSVSFDTPVMGVDPSDFRVATAGSVKTSSAITVSGGGDTYTVTLSGIHGDGTVGLNLLDDDSIISQSGEPLGGSGPFNGSRVGPSFQIVQSYPRVTSITRLAPAGSNADWGTVTFGVTFSEPVSGVDPSDFQVSESGSVGYMAPPVVSGSGAIYTVSINGVSGYGTLGLNLLDDGTIRNVVGNPLVSSAAEPLNGSGGWGIGGTLVAVADVNHDGRPDPVFCDGSSTLRLYTGGPFTQAQIITASAPVSAVALADVNGDGQIDVVAVEYSNVVEVFLGGSFTQRATYSVGVSPNSVTVSDVNGDGRPDILVGNKLLLGNCDGSFAAARTIAISGLSLVGTFDVNGDGLPDAVTESGVLLGNGDGTFTWPRTFSNEPFPLGGDVADVNGDGFLDVVTDSYVKGVLNVFLGNGDGTFRQGMTFPVGSNPRGVALGDFNGDMRPDVAVVSFNTPGYIKVLQNNGNGTFGAAADALDVGSVGCVVADLNGDGRPDVLMARGQIMADGTGAVTGPRFTVRPLSETINGGSGTDTIVISRDPDGSEIDWSCGGVLGRVTINDPNGLTINGNGGNDTITLDYTNGNPLPNTLHLNGTFTINGLQGANPLANTTMEIGQSTVYFAYSGASPAAVIVAALSAGYSVGSWNGAAGAGGAITSVAAAASGPAGVYGIGYADSADGLISGQPANTVEIRYTVMGDTNLDRVVDSTDAITMARNYLIAGKTAWDLGNFNYDNTINYSDALILQKNFKVSVPAGSAVAGGSVPATTTTAGAVNAGAAVTSATGDSAGSANSTAGDTSIVDKQHPKHRRHQKEKPRR